MRVRYSADVLADPTSWRILDRIVDVCLVDDERHLWDVADVEALENSAWLTSEPTSRATRRNIEALRKVPMRSLYETSHAHSITLIVALVETPPHALSPSNAFHALQLPVFIIVEDAQSDGKFLRAMIRAFERETLCVAFECQWCKIVHGGGSNTRRRIDEIVSEVGEGPRRIFVLVDSDRMAPDEETKEMKAYQEACRMYGIPLMILRKREIENYLPLGSLQRVPRSKKDVYHAFCALDQTQRDFFDMKKGFKSKDGEAVIPDRQAGLYRNVPQRIRRNLVEGFGDDIGEMFEDASEVITKDTIRLTCPDDPDELERILDAIERLL